MKKLKPIPKFKSEDAEAKFWLCHDSTDYVKWSSARRATFACLKVWLSAIKVEAKFIRGQH